MIDPEVLGLEVFGRIGKNEVRVRCPYHDDTDPDAEFNVEKGLFYCFACKESRTAAEVAKTLGGYISYVASLSFEDEGLGEEVAWTDYLKGSLALDHPYLVNERLVTNDQIRKHGILSHPQGVVFPIEDYFGQVTGIQIRHTERKPKYLIRGQRQPLWPMRGLYGTGDLYITEGVFGALRAERTGLSAVAMMGSGLVMDVVAYLRSGWRGDREVFVVMDNDFAGLLAAGKFTLLDIPALLVDVPADEMTPKQWRQAITKPVYDVNEVIDKCQEPERLQKRLEKFWRKLNE